MASVEGHPDGPHGTVVDTAYGRRTTCGECGRKWTQILKRAGAGDKVWDKTEEWVEEKYSSMSENVREVGYGDAQEA